jgi:hypothetical protein
LSPFDLLRQHQTCAPEYELSNDDIVAMVEKWNEQFGVAISEVGPDRFYLRFSTLPDNLDSLVQELCEFCPNIIVQDFANYPDILEAAEVLPADYVEYVRRMSEGIDFDDPQYPFELLRKSLRKTQQVAFMWD